jgi:translation initiation factor eIF-2B subunit delta
MENSVESTAILPPKTTEANAQAGEVKKATELEGKTQPPTKAHRSSPSSSGGKNTTSAKSVQQKIEPQKELGHGKDAAAAGGGEKKLTPAEMKKKAKEEKTARRAKAKELQQAAIEGAVHGGPDALGTGDSAKKGQHVGVAKEGGSGQKGGQRQGAGLGRRGSMAAGGLTSGAAAAADLKKKEDKNVAVFGHLYGTQRRSTIAGAGKEVHPAVLALGLQIRDYVICGSSARCVATLLAFKRVSIIFLFDNSDL